MKMRLNRVVLKFVLILLVWYGWPSVLYAQTREVEEVVEEVVGEEPYIRIITTPEVKVYVNPPENGTVEERDFFKENFEMELMGAAYEPVPTKEESDFYMVLAITRWEADDPANELLLTLFNTRTEREIVTLSWGYNDVTDMYAWNLYMIYQAMANAPIVKILPDATLTGVGEGNWWKNFGAGEKEKEPHKPAVYAGLRAGAFLSLHEFQTSRGYVGGTSRSVSGEAAVSVEYHPFRYLSVELAGIGLYESFGDIREVTVGYNLLRSVSTITALALQIPLYLKAPITFERISVSPFIGFYCTLPLGEMNINYEDTLYSSPYRVDPPLGISFGIDGALPLGIGKVVVGLRYDRDLGTTIGANPESPLYSRNRIGITAGYMFRVWEKKLTTEKTPREGRRRDTAVEETPENTEG
jgi:hypothetical protein